MYQVGPPGHSGDLCWVQCIWSLSCSCRFNFTWPIHIMFSYLSCGDCCHKEITRQAQRRGLVCAALDEAISPDLDILSAGGFLPLGFRRYSSMHMYIYIYTHIYISIHIYICIGCMPLRVLIACMATCVQSIAQKAQGHAGLCAPLAQGIPVHAVASLYLCEKKREREREREREMKICARIRGSSYAWVSRWSSGRLPILQEGMPSESTVKANIISARTLGV